MTRRLAIRAAMIALGFVLTMAACGDDQKPRQAVTPTASSGGLQMRWIAVIDVALDPNDLDDLTQRMLEPLGGALMVSPVDCFEGLPDTARDGYLIGAVGDSRREVQRLVVGAGEKVAFAAAVTIVCTD